jgi:hypothetical protein
MELTYNWRDILTKAWSMRFILLAALLSVILLELPRETTVTARLKRHNQGTGWRKTVAGWFEPILDPFDPSGKHI